MRAARGWFTPLPWREAAHLAFGLVWGVLLLASLALLVLLSPLGLLVPVVPLAAVLVLVALGRLEADRFGAVLGEPVARPVVTASGPDALGRWRALVADPGVRRIAGYTLVRALLAVLEVAMFTVVFTWPLVLLASAVRGLATGRWPVSGPFVDGNPDSVRVGTAIGLVVVLTILGPLLIRGLARLDVAITRALLGGPDAELEERVGELIEARSRVLSAAEAERTRIERDLHDGAQQRLIALGVSLGRAEERLRRDDPGSAALGLVQAAKAETLGVVADIRAITRGLRPPILQSRGLDAALSAVASGLRVPVEIRVDVGRLDPTVEAVLYFALTECLTNVAKHAPGASAAVTVERDGSVVRAAASDDGPGGASLTGGTGLAGIADRLAGVDGRLWLSSPEGGPTVVTMEVPCAS
jgi:signal transduction histidine kinase